VRSFSYPHPRTGDIKVANRLFRVLTCVFFLLTGCVTSHVLVGTPRPPISPDQVRVYTHPPARYEEIAILESSSRDSWTFTAQGKADKVIERMKDEAAKLGANGILLTSIGDQQTGTVGGAYGSSTASGNSAYGYGIGSSAAVFQKSGGGMAIYVTQN
jgi:hypothetical protein